jgi:hypothetical protein
MELRCHSIPSRFAPVNSHGVPSRVNKSETKGDKFAIASKQNGVPLFRTEIAGGPAFAGESWPLPSGQNTPVPDSGRDQ